METCELLSLLPKRTYRITLTKAFRKRLDSELSILSKDLSAAELIIPRLLTTLLNSVE